jgi:hypothetical protein
MRFTIAFTLTSLALIFAGCGGSSETATTTVAPRTEVTTTTETTTAPPTQTKPETTTQTAPGPTTVRIEVGEQGVAGGPARARLKKGAKVVLVVRSALADEVHVHGYDLTADVAAGGQARIRFTASIAGRFEVELEDRGLQIAELDVR